MDLVTEAKLYPETSSVSLHEALRRMLEDITSSAGRYYIAAASKKDVYNEKSRSEYVGPSLREYWPSRPEFGSQVQNHIG